MHLVWREDSNSNVTLVVVCCQKAAFKIHRIFYRNQVAGMNFTWKDEAFEGEDAIHLDIQCSTDTAKRIMAVYHQYKVLAPATPNFKSGMYECLEYPDPHNKIGAIKMIREVTGMGLKEAKDFSERISFHMGESEVEALTEKGFTLRLITSR